MATNRPTYYYKPEAIREDEAPEADWMGGMNFAASNACGIGISTAVIDPPPENWARIADEDDAGRFSEHLGHIGSPIGVVDFPHLGSKVAFVQADAETDPDGTLDAATGAINLTGQTVPDESWAWGVIREPEPEL